MLSIVDEVEGAVCAVCSVLCVVCCVVGSV